MSAAIKVAPTFKIGLSAKLAAGLVGSAGALYYFNEHANRTNRNNNYGGFKKLSPLLGGAVAINQATPAEGKNFDDYQEVYNAIAEKIRLEDDADDGAGRYGLLCRLAWHTSGTYEKEKGTGGSFGGTMNYSPELSDGANAGLEFGRATLLSIKEKFPWLSHGDLWTLGGVCAVQEAGGPKVKWRPGRRDLKEGERAPVENGRLPDASQGADHVKKVFGRMDFNDRETVALIGAHCLGKCHPDRSGYDGPWDESFTRFTNEFFVKLLEGWHVRKWDGPKQYQDDATNSLMMLPTDMALKTDSSFVKYVKLYASDQDVFFKDFSNAYAALLERGIKFPASQKPFVFQTLDEQDE